jgi:hypothetical protein
MIHRSITMMELPSGGWLWKEHDRTYKSAATAMRAISRENALIARSRGWRRHGANLGTLHLCRTTRRQSRRQIIISFAVALRVNVVLYFVIATN